MTEIEIYSDFIKLDAFLKYCGAVGTGGAAGDALGYAVEFLSRAFRLILDMRYLSAQASICENDTIIHKL